MAPREASYFHIPSFQCRLNARPINRKRFGMFSRLKNIFSRQTENESPIDDSDTLTSLHNPNFLVEPDKIIGLLTEIEMSSPLCTIQLEGVEEEYSSSILGIKPDKNLLILDELIPVEGNAKLQQKKALKLSTYHKGIYLSFNLSNIETGSSRGIHYYKAGLPSRIYYPQRRHSPRIEISSIDIAFTGISERTGINVSGYLFDLSRGGAGIDMPANRARIQRGDKIKNCKINFEDYTMDFDFSVRFVKSSPGSSSKIQIGGSFENLSAKSQSKLSYFITSLERVEIRKQKA